MVDSSRTIDTTAAEAWLQQTATNLCSAATYADSVALPAFARRCCGAPCVGILHVRMQVTARVLNADALTTATPASEGLPVSTEIDV